MPSYSNEFCTLSEDIFLLRNLYDAVDRGSNMKIVRPRGGGGVDLCSYDEAAGSPESEIYRLL